MSRVEVLVPEDEVEDARFVLLVDEVDAILDLPPQRDAPSSASGDRALWLVLVALLLLGVVPIVDLAVRHH
jgi:hypothetical protein